MSRNPASVIAIDGNVVEKKRAPLFSPSECLRLCGLYGCIAVMHLLGWGMYFYYSIDHPTLAGMGVLAYLLGLRHAFDADHISAVDDTIRFMLQSGRRPLGVGFYFSLGHASVVFILAVAIIFSAAAVKTELPQLKDIGELICTGVSGTFLILIGILNLRVLLDIVKVWGQARTGKHSHSHLEELLAQRGFINRLFGGRLQRLIKYSWHMYPLGFLFGLGFDTASEVGLLAMTATASTASVPVPALLSLPLLFAAGMSLMDTTDGIIMVKAYHWAFSNPLRKIYYNISITSLSVAVALFIGSIELLRVIIDMLGLDGTLATKITTLDFGSLGYVIVGLFLLAWSISAIIWKFGRIESRYATCK